jgi:hypothetical protein
MTDGAQPAISRVAISRVTVSAHRIPTDLPESDELLLERNQLDIEAIRSSPSRPVFDGAGESVRGELAPDPSRPGLGIEFRHADARRFRVE